MARIRTIKPEYWQDEKVGKLSIHARLMFIGMWNFSDDCGVVRGHPVYIRSQIFPYDDFSKDEVVSWIDEIINQGMVSVFTVNAENYYQITNFLKHQIINRPSKIKNPQPENEHSLINHGAITECSLINHGTITECSLTYTEQEQEQEKEKEKEKKTSCSEPKKTGSELNVKPSVISIPLVGKINDSQEFDILQSMIDDWAASYPAVNVIQELHNIRQWNIANPTRRKTKAGILRHINSWLADKQNKGGSIRGSENARGAGFKTIVSTGDRKMDISLTNAMNWAKKQMEGTERETG